MINNLLFILADIEIFGSDFFDKKDFIEGLTDWAKESKINIVFKGHPANPQSLYHFRDYISNFFIIILRSYHCINIQS